MGHWGIYWDANIQKRNEKRVKEDESLEICTWCHGTGNEFYSMYRECPECGGQGVKPKQKEL